MGRMNVDPIHTFTDGSELLVSTQHTGEGRFSCSLYLSNPNAIQKDGRVFRVVSEGLEAATCHQAQNIACGQARRLYPDSASTIKDPPYLVWPGPHLPMAPDTRWRRSARG